MNERRRELPARFAPETRFEVTPTAAAPFREVQESRLEQLKGDLLRERLGALWEPEHSAALRRAANDAAALAWVTAYPLLVFPALFEEKAEAALAHAVHQEWVRQWSREPAV